MTIFHDSRDFHYRNPQGAVPCGQEVELKLSVPLGAAAYVALDGSGGQRLLPMSVSQGGAGSSASVRFTAQDRPGLMWYSFLVVDGGSQLWYGGVSGRGSVDAVPHARWQLTVYDRSFETPDWFREGVCYQIFPDRFFRACSQEDFIARLGQHKLKGRKVRAHQTLTEQPFHMPGEGEANYAPDDYFGGDLEGIRQKLPYLAELGVSCLYLNPIFEADSNHRYNTADYYSIDPVLGDKLDFTRLAEDARNYGIRIILDGVFSHTGSDSVYFDRRGCYGSGAYHNADSTYRPWYRFNRWPDDYECWWGFKTLPNVNELEPSYDEFINGGDGVVRHWLRLGASGWRLDVADELPDEFIRRLRKSCKAENPRALVMGEVWEDCSCKYGPGGDGVGGRRGYTDGDELDCAMNYPFRDALLAFLTHKTDAYGLNDALQRQRERYPEPYYSASLNLISSHDELRFLSALAGAPSRNAPREEQLAFKPADAAMDAAKRKLVLAVALQTFLKGVPCVYYGDEAGMSGGGDPFNRGFYPWGHEDRELLSAFRNILAERSKGTALKRGRQRMGALGAELFCVVRYDENETRILIINRDETPQRAILYPALLYEGVDGAVPFELMGDFLCAGQRLWANGALSVELPPLSYRIITKEKA